MNPCPICGSEEARHATVSQLFAVDGARILVEDIPAEVCVRCGEPAFSRETAERLRLVVRGDRSLARKIELEAISLAR